MMKIKHTIMALIASLSYSESAFPTEKIVLGKLYPIIEKDALQEIEERVARTPFDKDIFGKEEDWSALDSPILPVAEEATVRKVVPFFSLSFDIPNKDGGILYPKGYTFNPLEYLKLPQRLIVVNESQLSWAFEQHEIGDMILLSGGNPLEAMRRHNRPVFKLEHQIQERLGLKVVPSVVKQEGTHFVVEEFDLRQEAGDD